ncbi:Wzz/FepE/Etk N-terminal domain-containing protein [Polynucleobacter sinensis]|uniref:Wzz/FepE/Etk N-terminal domain-containing protein n=1 Tax=Polynucleobacter sinensis TaxID=1743157 RepID=UPI00078182E9|nr:Wzz/FepE/Etk N-terminal domain-containing protein [Polynucleobacter sinensis]
MSATENSQANLAIDQDDDEISLIEIATTLGEEKFFIAKFAGAITLITLLISLIMTPIFTAKTTFLVPSNSGGGLAGAMGALGALTGGGGAVSGLLGGKTPEDQYIELLKSDTIANELIDEFDLQKRYEKKFRFETQKALEKNTKITSLKKAGMIDLEFDDKDPEFSARVANAYIAKLKKMMETFAITESQQRKEYFRAELLRAKKDLDGVTEFREMKIRESMVAMIQAQYEMAVLDSSKESLIQVVDVAQIPEWKSKPKRALMVLIAAVAGLFLATLIALVRRAYRNAKADPDEAGQWARLAKAWTMPKLRWNKKK